MSISFRTSEFKPVVKEFRGVIVDVDYGLEPFGMKGNPEIGARREQLAVKIYTDQYEKYQYEWYPPSNKLNTKWYYFIESLEKTGAIRDIEIKGETEEEKIRSLAESLKGMEFYWQEIEKDTIGGRKVRILLPVVYYGKKQVGTETVDLEERI